MGKKGVPGQYLVEVYGDKGPVVEWEHPAPLELLEQVGERRRVLAAAHGHCDPIASLDERVFLDAGAQAAEEGPLEGV